MSHSIIISLSLDCSCLSLTLDMWVQVIHNDLELRNVHFCQKLSANAPPVPRKSNPNFLERVAHHFRNWGLSASTFLLKHYYYHPFISLCCFFTHIILNLILITLDNCSLATSLAWANACLTPAWSCACLAAKSPSELFTSTCCM